MLEQTSRAIYYPNLSLTVGETRFGSKKLLAPSNPYVTPLKNSKNLVKIDVLECLKNIWGSSILMNRDNIYKLVSGDTDDVTYRKILSSYYKTHAAFSNYVDFIVMFGRRDVDFVEKFNQSVREYLNDYIEKIDKEVFTYGGSKFLLYDHEYRYYAVVPICTLENLEGVEFVK